MNLTLISGQMRKATEGSAGYDIFASEHAEVRPGSWTRIKTGVRTEFSSGFVALLRDKSGLALKYGLFVIGGVIDSDYRDEWCVLLYNGGKETVLFRPGDKLCNVLFLPLANVLCDSPGFTELDAARVGGFGSTDR